MIKKHDQILIDIMVHNRDINYIFALMLFKQYLCFLIQILNFIFVPCIVSFCFLSCTNPQLYLGLLFHFRPIPHYFISGSTFLGDNVDYHNNDTKDDENYSYGGEEEVLEDSVRKSGGRRRKKNCMGRLNFKAEENVRI